MCVFLFYIQHLYFFSIYEKRETAISKAPLRGFQKRHSALLKAVFSELNTPLCDQNTPMTKSLRKPGQIPDRQDAIMQALWRAAHLLQDERAFRDGRLILQPQFPFLAPARQSEEQAAFL